MIENILGGSTELNDKRKEAERSSRIIARLSNQDLKDFLYSIIAVNLEI